MTDAAGQVGVIAGWGRYPRVVLEALRERGLRTCCLGIRDHAEAHLAEVADEFHWIGLAQIGGAIRRFRRRGITEATLAGKVHKVVLFQPRAFWRHRPDWRTIRTFYPHFLSTSKDRNDDTLLTAVVDAFAASGIRMNPATDYAPQLLAQEGCLTRRAPTASQEKDIDFGWHLAKQMGRLDIGQCVAVKDRAVLAVEAIEGTDECIRRAGALCTSGGFTIVKVAKPQQDMRFDVPTIGLGTLENIAAAGGRVLAIEAGRTIIVDRPRMIEFADRFKLVIVARRDRSAPPPALAQPLEAL